MIELGWGTFCIKEGTSTDVFIIYFDDECVANISLFDYPHNVLTTSATSNIAPIITITTVMSSTIAYAIMIRHHHAHRQLQHDGHMHITTSHHHNHLLMSTPPPTTHHFLFF